MTTVTPTRHAAGRNDTGASPVVTPAATTNNVTPDDRLRTTHLLAANAMLSAKQSRQVKKLDSIRDLILSQEPLAIIPTIIELATSMTTHHEKITQRYAAVAKFSTKDDDGVLYVPKSARINIPITCSESIKENDKATTLIAEGVKNCTTARVALADTMRKMAQLELEMAINFRKIDFIRLTFSICEDLVFHTIKNEEIGSTTRSIEAFAFLCFQSFGETKLNNDFFVKLLSSTPNEIYDGMLKTAAPNHDPETDNLKNPSITGPEGLAINRVSDILAKFFVPITTGLKTLLTCERKTKDDNAKILARRKAKEIAAATEATAESLEKEPAMNYTTMLTVIQDESEKAAKKVSKTYLQSALRKKSLGSRRQTTAPTEPTTKSGNESKATSSAKRPNNKKVRFHDNKGSSKKASKQNKSTDNARPTNNKKTSPKNPTKKTGKGKQPQKNHKDKGKHSPTRHAVKRKDASNANGNRKKTRPNK